MKIHPVLWLHENGSPIAVAIWVAVCGLSVGWLVGMSASPTVQTLLSSLLTLVVAVVAVLAGVSPATKDQKTPEPSDGTVVSISSLGTQPSVDTFPAKMSLAPLGILCLAVAVGATVGGFARNNGLIGPSPMILTKRWSGTGLTREELTKRFLDLYYASQASKPDGKAESTEKEKKVPPVIAAPAVTGFGFFALPAGDACDHLVGLQGEVLKNQILVVAPGFTFPASCTTNACVAAAKEILCPSKER